MAYEFYGYPLDFLEKLPEGDRESDEGRCGPGSGKVSFTGSRWRCWWSATASEFDKPLSSLGAVTKIDIAIPPPPGEKPGN